MKQETLLLLAFSGEELAQLLAGKKVRKNDGDGQHRVNPDFGNRQ